MHISEYAPFKWASIEQVCYLLIFSFSFLAHRAFSSLFIYLNVSSDLVFVGQYKRNLIIICRWTNNVSPNICNWNVHTDAKTYTSSAIHLHTNTHKCTHAFTHFVKRTENQWNRRPIEINQVKLPIHCNNLFCWLNFVSVNKNTMFHHQNSE